MPFPTDFPSFKELARQADAGLFRTICSNPDMSSGIILLVHAFVTSRIDCCCSLLAGLPLGTLGRLDRVLRSAARLVGGQRGCPSFLPSLPTYVMYSTGCLYLSGYSIVSLQWSPVVSLAAPPLTSATSAAQCRFWPHVGRCVLLRRVSFWSLGPVWLLCSEGLFRL